MTKTLTTSRLILRSLKVSDAEFIMRLVNMPDWIRFIGERNVKNTADSEAYIKSILEKPDLTYWVINLKENKIPIGIVTFVKRENLEYHDIGFALLSEYEKNGYAYEAAEKVMDEMSQNPLNKIILATTLGNNHKSISLLEKLGLKYSHTVPEENKELLIFSSQKLTNLK